MFNKAADKPRRPAAPAPSAPPVPSLLGPGLVFDGLIAGDGELHVEGTVKGRVEVARLVVGEHAHVHGAIHGGSVEVRGRVTGDIDAQSVKLHETAHVQGDILHERLSIDAGAYFEGRSQARRSGAATETPQLLGPEALRPAEAAE